MKVGWLEGAAKMYASVRFFFVPFFFIIDAAYVRVYVCCIVQLEP